MRHTSVLILFVMATSLVACGGDEESTRSGHAGEAGSGGEAGGGGAGGSPGGTGGIGIGGTGATSAGGASGIGGIAGNAGTGGSGGSTTPAPVQACDLLAPAVYATPLGNCTESGWCWESPLPNSLEVAGIWGASDDDAWLTQASESLHWDGTSWKVVNAPGGRDVWGFATDDVWVAGDDGVHHFDGSTWTNMLTSTQILEIHGAAPNDVWAIGNNTTPTFHWNGISWTSVPPVLNGLLPWESWSTGPNSLWVTSLNGELAHFDGASWQDAMPPGMFRTYALWASGPNDLWIGGSRVGPSSTVEAGLVRWNGSTFSDVAIPVGVPAGSEIRYMGGRSVTDIWFATDTELLHWDGVSISTIPAPKGFYGFSGSFWVPPTNSPWLADHNGRLFRWNQSAWLPYGGNLVGRFFATWGSAWNDIWAVGEKSLAHFDGAKWTPSDMPDSLNAVWGASSNDVYAVGTDLWHFDGNAWSVVGAGLGGRDLWGTSSSEIWILDQYGATAVWNGSALTSLPTQPFAAKAIWASSSVDVWIAGGPGIARFDGSTWKKFDVPVTYGFDKDYDAIWGRNPNDVWAGGTWNAVHFDGVAWSPVATGIQGFANINDIWGCGTDTLAFMSPSRVGVQTSVGFDVMETGQSYDHGLWGTSKDNLVVVGENAGIKRFLK